MKMERTLEQQTGFYVDSYSLSSVIDSKFDFPNMHIFFKCMQLLLYKFSSLFLNYIVWLNYILYATTK